MQAINWQLQPRKVSVLKDFEKNPRTMTKAQETQLKHSMERYGIIEKPVITPDGLIIGGHQRKRILKQMGIKEVLCWVPDRELEDKEIEELNVRLNRNQGSFDFDVLANEWDINDLCTWGFDPKELVDVEVKEKTEKKKKQCPECGFEF